MTSPEAIGQILSCPKCGSFVMVESPPGWDLAATSGNDAGIGSQGSGVGGSGVGSQGSVVKSQESAAKQQPPGVQKRESSPSSRDVVSAQEAVNSPASKAGAAAEIASTNKLSPWKDPPVENSPEDGRISESTAALTSSSASSTTNNVFQPAPAGGNTAAVNPWPRWFWPGIAAAIVAGVLVFTLRLLLNSGEESPEPEKAVVVHEASSPGNELDTTSPTSNSADAGSPPVAANPSGTTAPANRTAEKPAEDTESAPAELAPATEATINQPAANQVGDATNQNQSSKTATLAPPPLPTPTVDATPAADTAGPASTKSDGPTALAALGEPQPAAGTLKRVAPRAVNLNARLAESVPKIDVDGQALDDFLEMVSAMSTVPVTLDADAVHDLGQAVTARVQLHLSDAGVAEILQAALEPLRLGYQVHDGQLVVGYPPQAKFRQVRYVVRDLVGDDTQALGDLGGAGAADGCARFVAATRRQGDHGGWRRRAVGGANGTGACPDFKSMRKVAHGARVAGEKPLRSRAVRAQNNAGQSQRFATEAN